MQTIRSDIAELRVQVADVCKIQNDLNTEFESLRELSSIVAAMKEEIRQLRESLGTNHPPSRPTTPKAKSGQPKQGTMYVRRFGHFRNS